MGQAGAQREPSMEEILASIRRIIENNEPGPDGQTVGGSAEAFAPHEPDDQHDAGEASHDAEYADRDTDSPRSAANDAPVAQPVSLADVAARARAMPDAHSQPDAYPEPDSQSRPAVQFRDEAPRQSADAEPDFIDAAAERLREALTSEEPVQATAPRVVAEAQSFKEPVEDQPAEVEPAAEGAASKAADSAYASGSAQPQQDEAEHAVEADHPAGSQLVSLQTGEKVAAAFGELDAAIAAGQQRSFDEIAEEMLRPMLTQWLDDNLPTLVERLVREEIERVSRGNRR